MDAEQPLRFPDLTRAQVAWILGSLIVAGWLVWLLGPVLTPFFISFLIAYMGNPVVTRLEGWRVRRDVGVVLVFLLVLVGLGVLALVGIPILVREAAELFGRLPEYIETIQARVLPWVEQHLDLQVSLETFDAASARELIQEYFHSIAGFAGDAFAAITQSGGRFLVWITGMLLVPLVSFYLLRDWNLLLAHLREMLPRSIEPTVSRLARDCDEALGGFLRGQLLVMISLGLIYSLGLWLVGLNNAFAIGMTAGLLSFVPYLGAIIGILLAGITAVIQSTEWWFLLSVALVFVVGQLLESFLLTPRMVGDRIGLHPVLVIFAVMAGGHLFGFTGILLALPVAAAATVLIRFFYASYRSSRVYDEGNVHSPGG